MLEENNILKMQDISKSFPGVRALNDVDLTVKKGEIHALIGENGAGKSTLMKVLLGLYDQDSGDIIINGNHVRINNPHDALSLGISMIHQELSLVPDRTIAENILMGREPKSKIPGIFSWNKLFDDADKLLKEIGMKYNSRDYVKNLTVAGQQMIEIARALSYKSDIIIMDEPTSALTDTEVDLLFAIMRKLKKSGISIIFISHKIDELFEIADRTTVLRDGKVVGVRDNADLNKSELIAMMVGRELTNIFPKEVVEIGEVFLEANHLTRTGVFEDVSFKVRKGEILGLSGLMGAGRTEVMRTIFGIDSLTSGELLVDGKIVHIKTPSDAIKLGFGMVTEDRKKEGLALVRSVKENISMATMKDYCKHSYIINRKEIINSKKFIEMLSIKTPSPKVRIGSLSGGNQQKAVLAKWLATDCRLMILDEPTRGIDVGAKSEIHRLMTQFAKKGMAIIMISSEMPEILGMSDRVIVMHRGRFKGELTRAEATQEKIMHLAIGEN